MNRLGLVKARTRVLRDLDFLWETSLKLKELHNIISTRVNSGADILAAGDKGIYNTLSMALKKLDTQILEKIREKAQPNAPYSALVKAWIKTRVEG